MLAKSVALVFLLTGAAGAVAEDAAGAAAPAQSNPANLENMHCGACRGKTDKAVCPPPPSRESPPSTGAMVTTKLRAHFLRAGHVAGVDVRPAASRRSTRPS